MARTKDKDRSAILSSAIAELWTKFKPINEQRFATVESAANQLAQGQLDQELRDLAFREAHKLAGALGSFGLTEGSRIAKKIELLLAEPEVNIARLQEEIAALGNAMQDGPQSD